MNRVQTYIIIALLLVIVFMRMCAKSGCPVCPVITKIDTVKYTIHDTSYRMVPQPYVVVKEGKPYPVEKNDTLFLGLDNIVVDTEAILKDYLATRYYSDQVKYAGDTSRFNGAVTIQDSVTQNKIKARRVIFNFNINEIHQTAVVPLRNQVYLGLDVGGSNGFMSGGLQLTLKTKTEKMYHAGLSFTTQGYFYGHVGTDWKIKL